MGPSGQDGTGHHNHTGNRKTLPASAGRAPHAQDRINPKLWETVKDLKAESLKELQATFRTMSKAFKINEDKNNLKSAGSKRGKEDKEASDSDDSDSSADKKPKKDSHIENIER